MRMAPVAAGTDAGTSGLFLERAVELSALGERLEAVGLSSRGQLVLVGGEAGVGKTTLLRHFCDAHSRSARILWGGCDALFTPRPLGPLLTVAHDSGGELEALVESGAMPHEVVAALAHELSARSPTVFVLEDVHWADEATLDVLTLLARRIETVPALVVSSYRDDELDVGHPLRLVLGELATSRPVARMKLTGLSSRSVAQLAEPYGVDAAELYDKTAGNPFFVVEALASRGPAIPDTVRDAVLARAARVSPPGRTLLEAVAVVPPQAELWLLDAIVGETIEHLSECLTSGMLESTATGVSFRHELARLALEESVAPHRKLDLHRRALAALADPPVGGTDLARLAHHAEAAGDAEAVLRFAPPAAARAAALGSYREAAAQYARTLRFGDRLTMAERADLLERRSQVCYVADRNDEAIEAIEEAVECRRSLGDKLAEGDSLRWLSQILWCPGRTIDADRTAREAVSLLEGLPPGRELAMAYVNLAMIHAAAARADEARDWAVRAFELAQWLDDTETLLHALTVIGLSTPTEDGWNKLERSLKLAQRAGLDERVGLTYVNLVGVALGNRRYDLASRHLQAGIDFCSDRGLERDRLYLLASRARIQLDLGDWAEAAESAEAVLHIPRTSITPRIGALVVLGLVRARRGDPEQWAPLDEAWALAEPTGELGRVGQVAAARAEASWLDGDHDAVPAATERMLALAVDRSWGFLAGELADWNRRAGAGSEIPPGVAEPYVLQFGGEWARAADAVAHARLPVRGRARTRRRGRREGAPALARRSAASRGTSGGGDRRPETPRARRTRPAAWPATCHAAEPGGPDTAGARRDRPSGGRAAERRDRSTAGRLGADGRPPRQRDPPQARRPYTRAGERGGRAPRARRSRGRLDTGATDRGA